MRHTTMKNIILIGFMGSGKSAIGEKLASKLRMGFIDTDLLIESSARMKIKDIFRKYGESYFRKMEKALLSDISRLSNVVVSTGGGIVKDAGNRRLLKKMGTVIYLEASPEAIVKRMKKAGAAKRPLLAGSKNIGTAIKKLLSSRVKLYASCSHHTVDVSGKSQDTVLKEIKGSLRHG